MKPLYGYCALTADHLHVGHINFLNQCASQCRKLIVGIMTDSCVLGYKGATPVVKQEDRALIIGHLQMVYKTMFQDSFNFPHQVFRLKDHYEKNFVIFDSEEHCREGADILIPRTKGISSSLLKGKYENFNFSQQPL